MKAALCILLPTLLACGTPPDPQVVEKPVAPVETTAAPAIASGAGSITVPAPPADDKISPKKIGARHVLIQYIGTERAPASVVRTKDQARAMAEEVLQKARAGEDLARLAVEYSDEPNAAQRGGSLGRFGKGVMAAGFEEAAFKLKVGEISDVVETQFGFHVIQRTE